MSGLLAGLGSILVSMLMKLIGYKFITQVTLIGLKAWAKTTASDDDDKVVAAFAEAWGVDYKALKELGGE